MRCCARVGVGLAPPLALLAMELGVGHQPLDTDGSEVKSGGIHNVAATISGLVESWTKAISHADNKPPGGSARRSGYEAMKNSISALSAETRSSECHGQTSRRRKSKKKKSNRGESEGLRLNREEKQSRESDDPVT